MEDWAEIRRLHRAEQMPIKAIARVKGVSRNTVRAAIPSDRPPKYERPRKGSVVDAVEPRIRELLGFGVQVPGGAPVLTWSFTSSSVNDDLAWGRAEDLRRAL